MTPKEAMIAALKALCVTHGVEEVADKARLSADNLRLIIDGRLLPSGAPRGVGPSLQRRLEAAYPDWAASADHLPLPANRFADRRDVSNTDFNTLQAVKMLMSERDLKEYRERYADIMEKAKEQVLEMGNGGPRTEK